MSKLSIRDLTLAAVLAAVYAVLTVVLPIPSYTGIQIRLAEAMTVLPFLFPAATPGLFVGCIIANLFSPYPLDVLCGSAATLLACLWTQHMPNRWLAPLPPVLCNAVIVGAEIAWFEAGFTAAFWPAYAFNAVTVGLGELAACYILGSLLLNVLPHVSFFRPLMAQQRLAQGR
ncbi:MAG: QueT transporter family protein [Lawsonibacter sp.]